MGRTTNRIVRYHKTLFVHKTSFVSKMIRMLVELSLSEDSALNRGIHIKALKLSLPTCNFLIGIVTSIFIVISPREGIRFQLEPCSLMCAEAPQKSFGAWLYFPSSRNTWPRVGRSTMHNTINKVRLLVRCVVLGL